MLTSELKAKELLYEVVEPRYFENAESLSAEDEQGSIYDFLKGLGTEEYAEWLKSHENDYYFEVVRVDRYFYAVAYQDYTTPAWAVEIDCPLTNKTTALDITVKSITMREGFYECEKHTSYWRKKAIEAMPWASKVVAVVGGYTGFESWDDYELWRNQK